MKNFAIIGAAGFVAKRHLEAIQKTKNKLIAAVDPHDSVGIMDSYFPEANYFREFDEFETFIEKTKSSSNNKRGVDFISVCSPNYLHEFHCRQSLKLNTDVICEKPIALNSASVQRLNKNELETGKKVKTIFQLRYLPQLIELRKQVQQHNRIYQVELNYITARGPWYFKSWKGQPEKSGGILTNIGVHFFDILLWIFGPLIDFKLSFLSEGKAYGRLLLQNAEVQWLLSIDKNDLPSSEKIQQSRVFRSMKIDGELISMSSNFEDLHTKCYQEIISGRGFGLEDSLPAIELIELLKSESITTKRNYFSSKDPQQTKR